MLGPMQTLWINSADEVTEHDGIRVPGIRVVRSGRLEAPHQTWGPAGAAMFESRCREWRERVASGERILVRPHHADVLSDVQRCLTFARSERGGLLLAIDPAGLLAPSMIDRAEDHMVRFVGATRDCPALGAIVLTSVEVESTADGPVTRSVTIDRGMLPARLMRDTARLLAEIALARRVPLILMSDRASEQEALLDSWIRARPEP